MPYGNASIIGNDRVVFNIGGNRCSQCPELAFMIVGIRKQRIASLPVRTSISVTEAYSRPASHANNVRSFSLSILLGLDVTSR